MLLRAGDSLILGKLLAPRPGVGPVILETVAEPDDDRRFAEQAAAEMSLLHSHLVAARDALIWKVEGLSDEERRRPMTPTGTNLIGLVKHMTWIEGWYLCEFFGRRRPVLPWESDVDADWGHHSHMYAKPEESTEELLAAYRATSDAADTAIEDLGLDAVGRHWSGEPVSMRSMLLTVLVDTVRHAGHSDIVREMIDGRTGDRHSPSGFYGTEDEEYRAAYLARVRGETDTTAWFGYITSRGKRWS